MALGPRRPPRHTRHSRHGHSTSSLDGDALLSNSTRHVKEAGDDPSIREILTIISSGDASARSDNQLLPITGHSELDLELYAFVALILKLCVQSWYALITPDKEINEQLVDIITHCIQALQLRLQSVDLNALVLDELPELVQGHFTALDMASRTAETAQDLRRVFHAVRPHPALDPAPLNEAEVTLQRENETAWSQVIVDMILPKLLPQVELQNPGLAVLVREILSEMILLNGVCSRVVEPWFLWECIGRAALLLKQGPTTSPSADALQESRPMARYAKMVQQTLSSIWALARAFWLLLDPAILRGAAEALSDILFGLWTTNVAGNASQMTQLRSTITSEQDTLAKRPLIDAKLWTCAAYLSDLNRRMPWLTASLSFVHWTLLRSPLVGGYGSTLDRWAETELNERLHDVTAWPGILRIARLSLFPGGNFAPSRPPPDAAEIASIKQACAEAILNSIPASIRTVYFAGADEQSSLLEIDTALDLLGDAYVNKALIISIVELLVARLFPELI